MIVVLAEKFSMAQLLARAILGTCAPRSRDAPFVGTCREGPITVTWADGHLCELAEFSSYNPAWKDWRLPDLPISPPNLDFHLEAKEEGRLEAIERLLVGADLVVNACDAAREGELIFDEIAHWCGVYRRETPIKRLWVSDTTPAGLVAAWNNLRNHEDKKLRILRTQARTRAKADQLWNLNLTRYATLALRDVPESKAKYVSVGRVRSPVLALIVDRCRDRMFFEAEDYFQGDCFFENAAGDVCEARLLAPPELKFGARDYDWASRGELERRIEHARSTAAAEWIVVEGESHEENEYPPGLFDTTDLQRTANRLLGWSAKKTMHVAQALYAKEHAISYPRTDCDKLPLTMQADTMALWEKLWETWLPVRFESLHEQLPVWNLETDRHYAERISDHYAIIPTGIVPDMMGPDRLMRDEYTLWELIALRFLGAWLPPAKVNASSRAFVTDFEAGDRLRALVKAAPVVDPAWLIFEDLVGKTRGEGRRLADRLQEKILPPMEATSHLRGIKLKRQMTTAPELYTYDMLLYAMDQNKLGTPATRADVLQSLIEIGYLLEDHDGRPVPTEEGDVVIALLRGHGGEQLLSPQITSFWEKQLEMLGKPSADGRNDKDLLKDLLLQIKELGTRLVSTEMVDEIVFCPKTRRLVDEREGGWLFGGWPDVLCPRLIAGREMQKGEFRDIFASGAKGAGPFEGFISAKTKNSFRAWVRFSKKGLAEQNRPFEFVFKARGG